MSQPHSLNDQWEPIGTVELLQLRMYPMDPGSDRSTQVAVQPGTYTVFRRHDAIRWMMRGRLSERFDKIGDGLFAIHGDDRPTGPEVEFSSPVFGVEQFSELLSEPVCQPGADQRLRFNVEVSA